MLAGKLITGAKLTGSCYCEVSDKIFFKWYKSQSRSFKKKCVHLCMITHRALCHPLIFGAKRNFRRKADDFASNSV